MSERFQLDFTEIAQRDRPGYGFQALLAEMGRKLGYEVEEGGTGADRGRDLFFFVPYNGLALKSESQKWLVTCKDFAGSGSSVSRTDVQTCYADAMGFNCYGVLLACTTGVVDDVVTLFAGWERNDGRPPLRTHIWNNHNIQELLHEQEDAFRLTLSRFFPVSYGFKSRTSDAVVDVLLKILEELDIEEAIFHAASVTQAERDPLILWRVAEIILNKKPELVAMYPLLKLWAENVQQPSFETAISSSIIEYLYEKESFISESGDALANCAPSFCGAHAGFTEFELTSLKLKLVEDNVLLECTGLADIEYTDSIDKDTGSTSFRASIVVKVTEYDYELESPYVENPSYDDQESEFMSERNEA